MNTYQISDLERLTGIKAHTIRVWEKRYKLIEPHRTPTNIRYYDDGQAKKLLNISTLLAQGYKISKISRLSDKEIQDSIRESENKAGDDTICLGFINDLIVAMLLYDELAFEKAFAAAITRFGMHKAMMLVVYPFLKKTGLMWSLNDTIPAQEHFASQLVRRKLLAAIDGLPGPSKKLKSFLLFLPMDEWHEISLLFSDYIIRSAGYKTIYLGQNVPLAQLNEVLEKCNPTHLLTFFIARKTPENMNEILSELVAMSKSARILLSGSAEIFEISRAIKNITVLNSPEDLASSL